MTLNCAFYCDFDGTISETDLIVRIVKKFAPPQTQSIVDCVLAGTLTVQSGVAAMFATIPSYRLKEVIDYARETTRVRPSFTPFVRFLAEKHWPLTVVSGGFDFFVEPALDEVRSYVDVACNRIDASGTHLRIVWHTPCDVDCEGGCGLCKPTVIRQRSTPGTKNIVIGDGVTDLKAARLADYVFARDQLERVCQAESIAHARFDTFDDIARAIESGVLADDKLG